MATNTGGPAFPTGTQLSQNNATGEVTTHQYLSDGLSIRDYFAAGAMQAIVSSNANVPVAVSNSYLAPTIAKAAYGIADAMLKERGG